MAAGREKMFYSVSDRLNDTQNHAPHPGTVNSERLRSHCHVCICMHMCT